MGGKMTQPKAKPGSGGPVQVHHGIVTPMLSRTRRPGVTSAKVTFSLSPEDAAALRRMADETFVGNQSAAVAWSVRLAVLALASEPLRTRRIGSPEDALQALGAEPAGP
jgi:hypothetical protein